MAKPAPVPAAPAPSAPAPAVKPAAASPTLKPAAPAPKITEFHKSGWWWVTVSVLAVALFIYGAVRGGGLDFLTRAPRPAAVVKPATRSLAVEIQPDQWSRWITEVPSTASVRIVHPTGWRRVQFWNGTQYVSEAGEARWQGNCPQGVFRLKGAPGTATVYWDP